MRPFTFAILIAAAACGGSGSTGHAQQPSPPDHFSMADFTAIEKIDIHFHLHSENTDFVKLAQHMNLPFLAAHLASLEWSVDELAQFLDRFPNAMVGMAARLGQLQYQSQQNRDRVVDFLTKYQDRILYGTDTGVGPTTPTHERYEQTKQRWLRDWKYFNTDEMVQVPELDEPVQGLALAKPVVEKIYRINAHKLFPKSWGQTGR